MLARLNSDGALDPAFGVGGKVRSSLGDLNDGANGAALQPDGKIVVVGFHPTPSNKFSEFAIVRYLNGSSAFSLTSAVSRKTHGSAGSFDVLLPLSAQPGIESRISRGNHTMVFTFSSDVVSGNASVTAGTGTVFGSPTFAGNSITVNLRGDTDIQTITVTLTNVTSSTSQVLPDTALSMSLPSGRRDREQDSRRL